MERNVIEIVANRIYFQVRPGNLTTGIHMDEGDGFVYHFHCMDSLYKTVKIRKYFGPLTLNTIHRYCALVDANLRYTTGRHLYYTNNSETTGYQQKRTNAIFLIGCYLVLRRNWTPRQAQEKLEQLQTSVAPYTDMEGSTEHALHLIDCWHALHRGMVVHKWFQQRDMVKDIILSDGSADIINWVVPDKLIALEDPKEPRCMGRGPRVRPSIVSFFKVKRVEAVVRLNAKDYEFRASYGQPYDSNEFLSRAIKHYDMFFKDGGVPSTTQVDHFLKLVKKSKNVVAVHCHAGRGRTGTMLACALMKFWGFEATEAIAWVRMCRVACIVGIQQDFLKSVEEKLRGKGKPALAKNTPKQVAKVIIQGEDSAAQKNNKECAAEKVSPPISGHLRGRRRVAIAKHRHNHRKTTRTNQKKVRTKSHDKGAEGNIENVTVLPISGALKEVRSRARQRVGPENNIREKLKVVLDSHLNASTNSRSKAKISEATKLSQQPTKLSQQPIKLSQHEKQRVVTNNTELIINPQMNNGKFVRKFHPFYEQQSQKVQYSFKGDNDYDKTAGQIVKPATTACLHSRSKSFIEKAKSKAMDGIVKCDFHFQKDGDSRKAQQIQCSLRTSKSSIPFAKQPKRHSSNSSTAQVMERLVKMLNYEKDARCPVPGCDTEHKPITRHSNENVNVQAAKNTAQKLCKKLKIVREPIVAPRRMAWQEAAAVADSSTATSYNLVKNGRKDGKIASDFIEKQRQAYQEFEVAHTKMSDALKTRDLGISRR